MNVTTYVPVNKMSFPLYDIFSREALSISDELGQDQKKKLIEDIKLLNQDGLDNLYLIIRYAARRETDDKVYNAKYNRKGVVFNLEFMPDSLQKTIYCFTQKHLMETQNSTPSIDIVFE
jgi:hypothetical protein